MRKILFIFILAVSFLYLKLLTPSPIKGNTKFWLVQSIDTMKFSRDASRSPLTQSEIDSQVNEIADTGATHVAIDTPYDPEFLPRLKEWVQSARKFSLNVWFRGNWSGWEGWFGYPKNLTRIQHTDLTRKFILNNPDLFKNGDIFTACPECENGGTGDPRTNGDINGFRQFMIDEYNVTATAFKEINKNVTSNYFSMNGDVARLIMDMATTKAIGEVVTIDHYVQTPEKLTTDISDFAGKSGGSVILGEFGTPIPDINGNQNETEQANWTNNALTALINKPELIGMNYWTNLGSSTSLWNEDGTSKKVVSIITAFFKPQLLIGTVLDDSSAPINQAKVSYSARVTSTNDRGQFEIPYINQNSQILINSQGIVTKTTVKQMIDSKGKIIVHRNLSFIDLLRNLIKRILGIK